MIVKAILVGVSVVIITYLFQNANKLTDPKCNLNEPSNRKFSRYFGIEHILPINHDARYDDNTPIIEEFINDTMRKPSIIVFGERGAGKTKLRNYRISRLNNNSHFIVKFDGNSIDKYLDNCVSNFKAKIRNSKDAAQDIIATFWTHKDYLKMIISELASMIVQYDSIDKNVLYEIQTNEIFEIASLLSFYPTDGKDKLLNKINYLLTSSRDCVAHSSKTLCQIDIQNIELKERVPLQGTEHDSCRFEEIKALFDKLNVWNKDKHHSARLLLGIAKIKGFLLVRELLEKSVNTHLDKLLKFFLQTIKKTPVIIVDSLDESSYLFFEGKVNVNAYKAFVNSAIHYDALLPALGNQEPAAFNTLLFFPFVEGLNLKRTSVPEQLPVIILEWPFEKLLKYGKHLFDIMRKSQINPCKELAEFKEFIKNPKLALEHIRHPRDLILFIAKLFERLNEVVINRGYNFVVNDEDIEIAVETLKFSRKN